MSAPSVGAAVLEHDSEQEMDRLRRSMLLPRGDWGNVCDSIFGQNTMHFFGLVKDLFHFKDGHD